MIDRSEAEWVHIDVMDGVFVPNISFGFPVMKPVRKATSKVLDVHLMIVEPEKYVRRFVEAGADYVTFHHEACADPLATIAEIKSAGAKAGVSVKPATPVEEVFPYLSELDMVLVMTVEPGFGGQAFMDSQLPTIRRVRELIDRYNPACDLEVDGGIGPDTVHRVVEAGANVLVAGSAVYGAPDPARAIAGLRV